MTMFGPVENEYWRCWRGGQGIGFLSWCTACLSMCGQWRSVFCAPTSSSRRKRIPTLGEKRSGSMGVAVVGIGLETRRQNPVSKGVDGKGCGPRRWWASTWPQNSAVQRMWPRTVGATSWGSGVLDVGAGSGSPSNFGDRRLGVLGHRYVGSIPKLLQNQQSALRQQN